MTEKQIVELMMSSKNKAEWNANCDHVKAACDGYPPFWYGAIIQSGLCDCVLGAGSSEMKISTFGPAKV